MIHVSYIIQEHPRRRTSIVIKIRGLETGKGDQGVWETEVPSPAPVERWADTVYFLLLVHLKQEQAQIDNDKMTMMMTMIIWDLLLACDDRY